MDPTEKEFHRIATNIETLSKLFHLRTITHSPFVSPRQRRAAVVVLLRVRPRNDPLAFSLPTSHYERVYPQYYSTPLSQPIPGTNTPLQPHLPATYFLNETLPTHPQWPLNATKWLSQEWVKRGDIEVCFIKRAYNARDLWSSQIGFPGGRKSENEDDLQTSVRECLEEVGLNLNIQTQFTYITRLDDYDVENMKDVRPLSVSTFVYLQNTPVTPTLFLAPNEVSQVIWVPLRLFGVGSAHHVKRLDAVKNNNEQSISTPASVLSQIQQAWTTTSTSSSSSTSPLLSNRSSFRMWLTPKYTVNGRERVFFRNIIIDNIDHTRVNIECHLSPDTLMDRYIWRNSIDYPINKTNDDLVIPTTDEPLTPFNSLMCAQAPSINDLLYSIADVPIIPVKEFDYNNYCPRALDNPHQINSKVNLFITEDFTCIPYAPNYGVDIESKLDVPETDVTNLQKLVKRFIDEDQTYHETLEKNNTWQKKEEEKQQQQEKQEKQPRNSTIHAPKEQKLSQAKPQSIPKNPNYSFLLSFISLKFPALLLCGVGIKAHTRLDQKQLQKDPHEYAALQQHNQSPFFTTGTPLTMLWGMTLQNVSVLSRSLDAPLLFDLIEYDNQYRRWKLRLYFQYNEWYNWAFGVSKPPPKKPVPSNGKQVTSNSTPKVSAKL